MEAPTLTRPQTNGSAALLAPPPPFRRAAVLGAGVMGSQIAAHLANAGLGVFLLDVTPAAIGKPGKPDDLVEAAFKAAAKLSPDPFFTSKTQERVALGNFDEDFERIAEADWIIEVVVEKMDVKRDVMARIEAHARPDAVISTNTSGLPIAQIAEGRSDDFKRRFLGTHFFNPPRYLKLFEVIPTDDTDPAVLERVTHFARVHLGKGVVIAKDTPNFIGNRIGIYGIMGALAQFQSGAYSIEEIDALTGELVGHPKSATFRTADVVGLDTLRHVAQNLYEGVPEDESRERFRVPDALDRLVQAGWLGQKSKAGFYRKEGDAIRSINLETFEYADPEGVGFDVGPLKKAGDLKARLNALYADEGRAGQFFRETTLDLLAYAARRLPEIADRPSDVDRAIRWGFGWEMGPFETWDALGVARVRGAIREAGRALPAWADDVPDEGFYAERGGQPHVWTPEAGDYVPDPRPADEWGLTFIKRDEAKTLWKNGDAALLDLGDGVALFEFRSKANSLGQELMQGLNEVLDRLETDRDLRGLVVGNEGSNFAVGANLAELAMGIAMGDLDAVGASVKGFQDTVQRVRYAAKPVVMAVHQRVLGGACEMTMACPNPVAAAETYIGLVELGVGLIPAGTGTMRLAALASERAPHGHLSEIQAQLQVFFENVAMATVATGARMGQEMGYIAPHAPVVMNAERRFHVAKQEVLRLSEEGYLAPPVQTKIRVAGRSTRAAFEVALQTFLDGRFISEYDRHLAVKLAHVLTGGDLTASQEVHEDYLLDLEREAFLSLLGEEKTQARITRILTTNKPLRN